MTEIAGRIDGKPSGAAWRFLVTGGAGFIGSAVLRRLIAQTEHHVLVVDKLTYAGNRESRPGDCLTRCGC